MDIQGSCTQNPWISRGSCKNYTDIQGIQYKMNGYPWGSAQNAWISRGLEQKTWISRGSSTKSVNIQGLEKKHGHPGVESRGHGYPGVQSRGHGYPGGPIQNAWISRGLERKTWISRVLGKICMDILNPYMYLDIQGVCKIQGLDIQGVFLFRLDIQGVLNLEKSISSTGGVRIFSGKAHFSILV